MAQQQMPVKSEVPIMDQNQSPKGSHLSPVTVLSGEPALQVRIDAKEDQSPNHLTSGSTTPVHWTPDSQAPNLKALSPSCAGLNPYFARAPAETSDASLKDTMETVKDVIGRWGKKVGEAALKAESLAGNTWQHLKTAPSFADAAMGRIAQSTKVLAEGGYEKIFRQTFETFPEEQLQNSYACFFSTSAGPIMGVLYISTAKLAYCSDNPVTYKTAGRTDLSYYKVAIPLHQLKSVNPSKSLANPAEKYIQVVSVDDHEFWFMGFLNYEGAVTYLQDTLQAGALQSV